MSQQPPYGPSEPQQPYQPPGQQAYTPYSPGAYPNPYAQFEQPKSNTTRNVLIGVAVAVVLFCGGFVALIALAINNAEDAFDDDFPGSDEDPFTVTEGEAFSIRGFDYDKGWRVVTDGSGTVSVDGMRVTNNRDDKDAESVYLHLDLFQDNVRVATVTCSGGSGITYERSAQLTCSGYDDVTGFDEIEVYDSSVFE